MDGEPRNAASDKLREGVPSWSDREFWETSARNRLADGFVREDRRKTVSMPTADADTYVKQVLAIFDHPGGAPRQWIENVVAVRGDRLVLYLRSGQYENGWIDPRLVLSQYDEQVELLEKAVNFDPEDVDAAIAELDRIHAELEGEPPPSPQPAKSVGSRRSRPHP